MVHMGRPTARKTGHMKLIPTGIRPDEPIQCLLPITRRRLQNQPGVCQRRQIAIHRTETDRRRFCLIQQSLYVSGGKGSIRMVVEELKRRLRCAVMYIPITSFVLHLIAETEKKQMKETTICESHISQAPHL